MKDRNLRMKILKDYLILPNHVVQIQLKELLKLIGDQTKSAHKEGYAAAMQDMQARYLTKRQLSMLVDIKSGSFTTYYDYAKRFGITHQAAQQTYKILSDKGLISKP